MISQGTPLSFLNSTVNVEEPKDLSSRKAEGVQLIPDHRVKFPLKLRPFRDSGNGLSHPFHAAGAGCSLLHPDGLKNLPGGLLPKAQFLILVIEHDLAAVRIGSRGACSKAAKRQRGEKKKRGFHVIS
jgi:hypothetical protein